ncbi:MAG: hypothetical protein JWM80_4670 [Cyanobacteria bacterium RYN_339]|nr:hypothetical protein [Cyanobacteria bacterium RYN_339]
MFRLTTAVLIMGALSACQTMPLGATPAPVGDVMADLAPPAPGEGEQLVAGPFSVPPGGEVQNNFYMKLKSDHDVLVDHIDIVYPKGSHHCNCFKSDTLDVPDHVDNTFDAMYPKWDMFANSQTGDLHWDFPPGVAMRFKAHQQLNIQSHYVNTLTQQTPINEGLKVKVNLHYADPAKVKSTMGMFFAVNPSLKLLPHSTFIAQKSISLADQGLSKDVKVIAMSGHFHSRGKDFQVNRWEGRDPNVRGEEVYESKNWEEPPFKIYDKPFDLKSTERLLYTGTYVNKTDITIGFGAGNLDTKEHSNLFMYFYPGPEDGKTVYDVTASQFQEVGEI